MTDFRAVLWGAVSSKPQAEKDSVASQFRDARALCEERQWPIAAELEVPGHSREYIFLHDAARDMDAYARLIELCDADAFDLLICRGRDRLGRTDALIAQVEAIVRQASATVYSMTIPSEPEQEPSGRDTWLSAIERAKAQDEIRELTRRSTQGSSARTRQGFFTVGNTPYGYRKVHELKPDDFDNIEAIEDRTQKDMVIYEPEARIVRMIYDWYLDGMSIRAIAVKLNGEGHKPPRVRWNQTQVRRMLRNPTYIGRVRYGVRQNTPRGETIMRHAPLVDAPGRHTAIIDAEKYHAAVALMTRRGKIRGRAAASTRLLTGLLYCECGYAMQKPHNSPSYYCQGYYHRKTVARPCTNKHTVREDELQEIVKSELRALASNPIRYSEWTTSNNDTNRRDALLNTLASIEKSLTFWNRQAERGHVAESEWLENRQRLQMERDAIGAALHELDNTEQRITTLPTADEILSALDESKALRQMLLRTIDRVVIDYNGNIDIHWI